MKKSNFSIIIIGALLLCACSSAPKNACTGLECRELGVNNQQLTIWWTPILRDGTDDYSTVSVHE